MTLGRDANFSDEAILTRYNADLANDLGNVVSRTATMIARYCDGDGSRLRLRGRVWPRRSRRTVREGPRTQWTAFALHEATRRGIRDVLVRGVNQYIVKREPWRLAKEAEDRRTAGDEVLFTRRCAARRCRLVDPVMPEAADRIRRTLGCRGAVDGSATIAPARWRRGWRSRDRQNRGGSARAEDDGGRETDWRRGEPAAPGATQAVGAGVTPAEDNRISIDEFMKVELRVAKVLEAEAVPKSKKLVKLKVDVGTEQRTIVAGIAEAYQPEQLVGRTIAIVYNLKPAKLMGIESNGMVLAASVGDGKPILVSFDEPVPPERECVDSTSNFQLPNPTSALGIGSWFLGVDMIDSHCHIAGPEFAADLADGRRAREERRC